MSNSFVMPTGAFKNLTRPEKDVDKDNFASQLDSTNDRTHDRSMMQTDNAFLVDARGRALEPASSDDDEDEPSTHLKPKKNNKKYRALSPFAGERMSAKIDLTRVVGLQNPSLDCFMNASLQNMF